MTKDEQLAAGQLMLAHAISPTIKIQVAARDENLHWTDCILNQPRWDWERCNYRIAPDPKLRPWKRTEVPVGKEIVERVNGKRLLITEVDEIYVMAGRQMIHFDELLAEYDLTGGTPCGVMEDQP